MKILGIDTSTKACSAALFDGNTPVCEYIINDKKTHSQKLMPIIEKMLEMSDISIEDIDAIAVSVGPGSFTGLRIGMATAKAIAHVNKIPVISVDSLETIAYNIEPTDRKICAILDAQRTHVYTANYSYDGNILKAETEISVKDIDELLSEIGNSGDEYIIAGEAVYKYFDKISEYKNIKPASPANCISKASGVCTGALIKYEKGEEIHTCYDIAPVYIRKSQAEVQYEEKMKKLKASSEK